MIAENRHTQVMCRIVVVAILLVYALAVMAEDVTFMSNRRHWEKLPTATLMKMGVNFMKEKNMPDSAMLCYSLAANRYNENLDRKELEQCILATCQMGTIYCNYYLNQAEAYKQFLKTKDLAERCQYDVLIPRALMGIGNVFWRQTNIQHDNYLFKEALTYHKAAFWKAIESKALSQLPIIFTNLEFVAFSKNELAQTAKERATFEKLRIPDSAELKAIAMTINHGMELISQERYEQAIDTFRSASYDNLNTNMHNISTLHIMINSYIYRLQLRMGRNSDALNTLKIIQGFIIREQPELIADQYFELSEFYKKTNESALADKYELLWWRANDSIAEASQANNLSKVGFLYELDKMNEEQKVLALKQQHDRQLLWVVSGFLALALVLITLLIINRKRIKEKNRVLYENNVELLAADEQRRKLAELQQRTEAEKYGAIRMDEQSAEELWQNIIHVMEYSPEIYDENFSEPRLAELIEAKQNYVSQAINQQKDWNFSSLVTHYRIREACRRMNDTTNYGNFTVEGIGQSVGYSSRSHFVKLFKRQTGLTPSDYMKQCRAGTPPEVLLQPHPLSTSVQSP